MEKKEDPQGKTHEIPKDRSSEVEQGESTKVDPVKKVETPEIKLSEVGQGESSKGSPAPSEFTSNKDPENKSAGLTQPSLSERIVLGATPASLEDSKSKASTSQSPEKITEEIETPQDLDAQISNPNIKSSGLEEHEPPLEEPLKNVKMSERDILKETKMFFERDEKYSSENPSPMLPPTRPLISLYDDEKNIMSRDEGPPLIRAARGISLGAEPNKAKKKSKEDSYDGLNQPERLQTVNMDEILPEVIGIPFIKYEKNILTLTHNPITSLLNEMKPRKFKTLKLIDIPNSKAFELVKDEKFITQIKVSECREILINISDQMEFLKSSAWTALTQKYKGNDSSVLISFSGHDKLQVGWRAKNKEKLLSLAVDKKKFGFNNEVEEFYLDYLRNSLEYGRTGEFKILYY